MRRALTLIPYLIAIAVFAAGGALLGLAAMGMTSLWMNPSPLWILGGAVAATGTGIISLFAVNHMYYAMSVQYEQIAHQWGPANEEC